MKRKNFRPSNQERTQRNPDGSVRVKPPSQIQELWAAKRGRFSPGSLLRGYVVAVYAGDDPTASRSPVRVGIKDKVSTYLCDVQVTEGRYSAIIPRVPIVTGAFGVSDRILSLPRAATKDLKQGNAVSLETTETSAATPIHDADGDCVIVAFLDNDLTKPIIIGALQHPQTLNPVSYTDTPPRYEAILRGNRIAIEDDGKIVIDATGQATGETSADGSEVASSDPIIEILGASSTVKISTDGVIIESDGVTIELGAGSKTTIGGYSAVGIGEALVKAGAWDDLFDPAGGAFWVEVYPLLSAVAGMFGMPLTNLAAVLATFSAGVSTTGATITTESLESE